MMLIASPQCWQHTVSLTLTLDAIYLKEQPDDRFMRLELLQIICGSSFSE